MWNLIKGFLDVFLAYRSEEVRGKNPLYSKTVWAMVVAALALVASKYAGVDLTSDQQVTILAAIGILLRFVSKGSVGFYEGDAK